MANLEGLLNTAFDKVVLVGDVGVGKTSIFNRFTTGEFKEANGSQNRMAEYQKKWQLNGAEVSVSPSATCVCT